MPTFTGQLSIIGHQSNLDDNTTDWLLLKAGIADPAQATFAATQFLVKVKKLHSGQIINVMGSAASIGSVSVISMTNASPAGPQAMLEADLGVVASKAVASSAKKRTSKSKRSSASKTSKKKARKKSGRKSSRQ